MLRLVLTFLCAALLALSACGRTPGAAAADPPLPRSNLTLEDRAAWHRALDWPLECERSFLPASEADAGMTLYPLAEGLALVEVVCLVAAYQRSQIFLTYDERTTPARGRLLSLPTYTLQPGHNWAPEQISELAGIAEFDPEARELTVVTKFRGVGDCGSVARYGFDGGEPVLLDFRGKADCDGGAGGWERIGP